MTEKKKKKLISLIRFHSANKINNCNGGRGRRKKKKKKKLKGLIRFHSANEIDNYNGGRRGGGKKKRKKKKNTRETAEQVKTRIINVFL